MRVCVCVCVCINVVLFSLPSYGQCAGSGVARIIFKLVCGRLTEFGTLEDLFNESTLGVEG